MMETKYFFQCTSQIAKDSHTGIPFQKAYKHALGFSHPQTAGRKPELPYDPVVHECDGSDNWLSKWSSDKDTDVIYH